MTEANSIGQQLEEALRLSSAKAAAIVENATEQVMRVDASGTIISVYENAVDMLGYRPDEVLGKSIAGLGITQPQDLARIVEFLSLAQQHGCALVADVKVIRKDGTSVWMILTATPKGPDGRVEGVLGMARDIAERRRVEEELRAGEAHYRLLADNVRDIIWTLENRDGRWLFTYLSPSVTRVLGFTVEEAIALDPADALTPASWDMVMNIRAERESEDRVGGPDLSPVTIELEQYCRDGSTIWTESLVTMLDDGQGNVGAMGVTRDITERRKSEEKLQQLYKQERELRQQIEAEMDRRIEFTRALAHELKTPLTPVMASIDSLLAELQDERLLSLARNISRGASSLNSRIDELLDLARGEVGILELSPESVDLLPMLYEVADSITPVALSHGQSLVVDLPPSLPPVQADVPRMQQVLLNLLENAIKFTPRNGKITMRVRKRAAHLVFEVQDTGRGMSREEQTQVFEPYLSLARDRGRQGGLGLGLALCKTLVELHGGEIWVRSQVDRGSTFVFSLPLEPAAPQETDSETVGKLWKVLAIEDDQQIVDSILLAFQKDWPEADLISTRMGEEGIEMVETEEPDLVILDMGLPDIDGMDVLKSIRLFSSVPVVVVTVRESEADVTRGLDCGANDYITKPFRKGELLSRLKVQLRKHTPLEEDAPVVCGALRLDPSTYQLTYGGREISLTVIEGRILQHLMQNAGHVTPYSRLTEAVWGEDYPGAIDSLRVYIGYLRGKLEADPSRPKLIRTKAGVGYSLARPD